MQRFISKLAYKSIIVVLAFTIVVLSASIIDKQFNISPKLSKLPSEVAGVLIGKFLTPTNYASAQVTSPYQNVSGDVSISGKVNYSYDAGAYDNIGDASIYLASANPALGLLDTAATTGLLIVPTGAGGAQFRVASTTSGNVATAIAIDSVGSVGVGAASPNGKLDVYNSGSNGDGAVFAPDITLDNNFTIQTYIDALIGGGGWAGRTTYAGGCCNNLALQPNIGTVSVGGTSANYGSNKFNVIGDSYFSGTINAGGGFLNLYGPSWNLINLGGAGLGTPSDTSTGLKIKLWDSGSATSDYGFGINNAELWSMAGAGAKFTWYQNGTITRPLMSLSNGGDTLGTHIALATNGSDTSVARIYKITNMENLTLASNARYNGTNWEHESTGESGNVIMMRGGMTRFYYVPPGTGGQNGTEVLRVGSPSTGTRGGIGIGGIDPSSAWPLAIRNMGSAAGKQWFFGPDTNNHLVVYNQNGTGVYILDGGTGWNANSDQRLKTNVQTLSSEKGLSAILNLNPVTYNWIDAKATKATQTGFIAQDVQKVLPELVLPAPETTIILPDGSTQKITDTLGLNYTGFIPYLVKSIQEQQNEIDQLKQELENLKSQLQK